MMSSEIAVQQQPSDYRYKMEFLASGQGSSDTMWQLQNEKVYARYSAAAKKFLSVIIKSSST